MKPLDKLSPSELDELSSDARAFMNSQAYDYIFESLREKYVQQLLQANIGDLTATSAHASMKVLADVQSELRTFENEVLVRGKRSVRT